MEELTTETARNLLHQKVQNINLRRHCYAVSIVLRALHDFYKSQGRNTGGLSAEEWEVVGLLHDSDYEQTKDTPEKHTLVLLDWLKDYVVSEEIVDVFKSHNTKVTNLRDPKTLLEWSLECCDELTGFIVAVALVRPSKKLADVGVEAVLKKFKQKEFARAVEREQIAQCEEKLGIPLEQFVEIALEAMQKDSEVLGL